MNRKLLVTLLHKSIQELEMITEGFMEMEHYPKAIIQLAKRKTDDIQSYIEILSTAMPEALDDSFKSETDETSLDKEDIITESTKDDTITTEEPHETVEEPAITKVEETEVIEQKIILPELIEEEEDDDEVEDLEEEIEIEEEEDEDDDEITSEASEVTESEEITTTAEIESEEEEIIEQKFTSNETRTIVEETRKSVIGDKNAIISVTRNELLSKTENTISSTLANKKITDIKQGISIGDRFRFQRELFRGNGEDMNKTISYLNQLATINEAISFLVSKYGWATDNETAEDFYQIVRRRFL